MRQIIIGGGAAGIFAAIRCKELLPFSEVIVLEKTNQLLSKVRISGGGRCNVTHACFEAATLVKIIHVDLKNSSALFIIFNLKTSSPGLKNAASL